MLIRRLRNMMVDESDPNDWFARPLTTPRAWRVSAYRRKVLRAGGRSWPALTLSLIILMGFLTCAASRRSVYVGGWHGWVFCWGQLSGPLLWEGQWWRALTNGLLHAEFYHFFFNSAFLIFVGQRMEWLQGRWRTAGVIVISALFGSLMSLLLRPQGDGYGSSLAVWGLGGALIVTVIRYWRTFPRSPIRVWWFWLLAASVGYQIYVTLTMSVNHAGHLGGLIGGVLAGFALGRSPIRPKARRSVAVVAWAALVLAAIGIGMGGLSWFWVDRARAYTWVGNSYRLMRQDERALRGYRKAFDAGASTSNAIGDCLADLGRLDEALAAYQIGIESGRPDLRARGYRGVGRVCEKRGDADAALAAYQNSVAADATIAGLHGRIGWLHKTADRPDDAVASFTRAVELDPWWAWAHWQLGELLLAQGQLDVGVEHIKTAVNLNRPWIDLSDRVLGEAYFDAGRYEDARLHLRAAEMFTRVEPDVRLKLAMAYMKTGDQQRALDTLRQVEAYWSADELEKRWPGSGQLLRDIRREELANLAEELAPGY